MRSFVILPTGKDQGQVFCVAAVKTEDGPKQNIKTRVCEYCVVSFSLTCRLSHPRGAIRVCPKPSVNSMADDKDEDDDFAGVEQVADVKTEGCAPSRLCVPSFSSAWLTSLARP